MHPLRALTFVAGLAAMEGRSTPDSSRPVAPPEGDRVVPNDNRVPSGVLRNGVLVLRLEAVSRPGIPMVTPRLARSCRRSPRWVARRVFRVR